MVNVLSLFDWISCARCAFDRVWIKVSNYYASEIDKYAIKVSETNYWDIVRLWSVVGLRTDNLHPIDILIWWSPCQDLSIANKERKWLEWSRSWLFYEYVRILNEARPKFFVLENVNSMSKEAKATITKELFGIEPAMINASLVSAQNRKRLFRVGKLVWNSYIKVDIELPPDRHIVLSDILESTVDSKYYVKISDKYGLKWLCGIDGKSKSMTASRHKWYGNDWVSIVRVWHLNSWWQWDRIYSSWGKSVSLSANWWWRWAKTGLYAVSQRGRHIVDGKRKDVVWAKTQQRLEVWSPYKAHSLTSVQKDSMVMYNAMVRKLTPIECERLQWLPDNYTEWISDTQRYKCLGNAFNVDVVWHILSHLFH